MLHVQNWVTCGNGLGQEECFRGSDMNRYRINFHEFSYHVVFDWPVSVYDSSSHSYVKNKIVSLFWLTLYVFTTDLCIHRPLYVVCRGLCIYIINLI